MKKSLRMRTFQTLALVVISCLMLTSCGFYQEVEVIAVEGISVKEFSKDIISADVNLRIFNPNGYKIKLADSDIDLFLNGKKLGKMHLREPLMIPKKDTTVQVLHVTADYSQAERSFLGNSLALLLSRSVTLEAKGYVKGKVMGVGRKVPVDVKEEISTEDIKF